MTERHNQLLLIAIFRDRCRRGSGRRTLRKTRSCRIRCGTISATDNSTEEAIVSRIKDPHQ